MIIDGINFNIMYTELSRSADFLDKYAQRTADGDLKRELIGVYYNYQVKIGIVDDITTYHALWDKLTEPVPFHTVTLPSETGTYTFKAYVSGIKDNGLLFSNDKNMFYGLTVDFISKTPARK